MKQKVPKGRDAKPNAPFLSTIEEIRRRARQHMESGSVTEAYDADVDVVVRILNEALATEIVCVLRFGIWVTGTPPAGACWKGF